MNIVYISDYPTHHVIPLCEELYRLLGEEFLFISTKERIKEGESKSYNKGFAYYHAESSDYPWCRSILNTDDTDICVERIETADAVITANTSDEYIKNRLKAGGLTFRAHERWYRESDPGFLKLHRAIIGGFLHHGRYEKLYMLCASAYTAKDSNSVGCFKGKCYKWGYFPETVMTDEAVLMQNKIRNRIVWAGRDLELKHPELAVYTAEYLKGKGIDLEMHIFGIEKDSKYAALADIKGLSDRVLFHGTVSPETLRKELLRSEIFLMTSDRREGWGAILNEAMNSGCAVVASHAAGAVPFLIKDGENGFVYQSGNVRELTEKVGRLLQEEDLAFRLGKKAYETIRDLWNAEVAAERLITLVKTIKDGTEDPQKLFADGPCSEAEILEDEWYHS